jgi:hypothetical protein
MRISHVLQFLFAHFEIEHIWSLKESSKIFCRATWQSFILTKLLAFLYQNWWSDDCIYVPENNLRGTCRSVRACACRLNRVAPFYTGRRVSQYFFVNLPYTHVKIYTDCSISPPFCRSQNSQELTYVTMWVGPGRFGLNFMWNRYCIIVVAFSPKQNSLYSSLISREDLLYSRSSTIEGLPPYVCFDFNFRKEIKESQSGRLVQKILKLHKCEYQNVAWMYMCCCVWPPDSSLLTKTHTIEGANIYYHVIIHIDTTKSNHSD